MPRQLLREVVHRLEPIKGRPVVLGATRTVLVLLAVALWQAAGGLEPPYPFVDLLPADAAVWAFRVAAVTLVVWAVRLRDPLWWLVAWVGTTAVLVVRALSLWLLTDLYAATAAWIVAAFAGTWATLGLLLGVLAGAADRWAVRGLR